jgi:hypothetical protein
MEWIRTAQSRGVSVGTVIQHLEAIEHRELVLPEFQREYVWNLEQAKQLMVSLFRGYPTGSLLFWETANPPEIKNNALPKNHVGRIRVLLDGQQRLTTLYLLIKGQIPPYYSLQDITHDPRGIDGQRGLHFHLLRGEFEYPAKESNDPLWVRVIDFFGGKQPNIFALAQEYSRGVDPMQFAQQLNANVMALESIKQREYPVQTVPTNAGIEDAIDVFDRVNSLGTSLTKAELALTHMSGKWPEVRRIFKQKLDALKKQSFNFDLDFLVRCITGIATGGALYERAHKVDRPDLEAAWKTLDSVLDTLLGILRGRAYVHSTDDLSTNNVLVPLIVYLAHHGGKFENDRQMRRFLYWMYQALLWARYSGRTDETLERDINHVLRDDDPVTGLLNEIVDSRGRLDLRPADLEGRGIDHPAFRIMHIAAKAQGAVDWFTGVPLAGNSSIGNGETYHIFPRDVLYAAGKYTSDNHMHRKVVNEIANRVVLEKWIASTQPPAKILPQVVERNPDALAQQFVPTDPELWQVDSFEQFLALRREMIANGINSYLGSLIDERIPEKVFPQITKLKDAKIAAEARDAVAKLTLEEATIGLFKLGRLFEGVLKEFVLAVEKAGRYPVSAGNYGNLNSMINWVAAQGIISDAAALHVLRHVRNEQAHPSLEEKRMTLNSAASIAGIYLDYILFFAEQRDKLASA